MSGLFDLLNVNQEPLTPQQMGLLGMAAAGSQAYAPQPASRLPLAKPTLAYSLGQMAGGYGNGYLGGLQAQGQQIGNLNAALNYNLWAPMLGVQPIRMAGLNPAGAAAPGPTSPVNASPVASAPAGPIAPIGSVMGAPAPNAQGGAPSAPAPSATGVAGNPGAPIPAPAQAAPSAVSGQPDLMTMFSTMPPPLLQHMGVQVPPELTAAFYAGIKPGTPEWQNIVRNVAIKASGAQPVVAPTRPGMLPSYYNLTTGKQEFDTSAIPALSAGQEAAAAAAARGKIGPETQLEQNKLDAQSMANYGRHVAFGGTGGAPAQAAPAQASAKEPPPVITDKGTAIPARPMDEIPAGAKNYDSVIEQSKTLTTDWDKNRGLLDVTANRLETLGQLHTATQSAGFNEQKADWANKLRGLGLNAAADKLMDSKDTSNIKRAEALAFQEVLGQLKTINTGAGGRILKVEVEEMKDRSMNSDLPPAALHGMITDTLGAVYQSRNMIDDFHQSGWVNAGKFQSEWFRQPLNSLSNHQEVARGLVGPLKGMPGNGIAPPPPKSIATIPGLQYSASRKQYRDPATNKVYDAMGAEVK